MCSPDSPCPRSFSICDGLEKVFWSETVLLRLRSRKWTSAGDSVENPSVLASNSTVVEALLHVTVNIWALLCQITDQTKCFNERYSEAIKAHRKWSVHGPRPAALCLQLFPQIFKHFSRNCGSVSQNPNWRDLNFTNLCQSQTQRLGSLISLLKTNLFLQKYTQRFYMLISWRALSKHRLNRSKSWAWKCFMCVLASLWLCLDLNVGGIEPWPDARSRFNPNCTMKIKLYCSLL